MFSMSTEAAMTLCRAPVSSSSGMVAANVVLPAPLRAKIPRRARVNAGIWSGVRTCSGIRYSSPYELRHARPDLLHHLPTLPGVEAIQAMPGFVRLAGRAVLVSFQYLLGDDGYRARVAVVVNYPVVAQDRTRRGGDALIGYLPALRTVPARGARLDAGRQHRRPAVQRRLPVHPTYHLI